MWYEWIPISSLFIQKWLDMHLLCCRSKACAGDWRAAGLELQWGARVQAQPGRRGLLRWPHLFPANLIKKLSQAGCWRPAFPALWGQTQKNHKFQANLGNLVKLHLRVKRECNSAYPNSYLCNLLCPTTATLLYQLLNPWPFHWSTSELFLNFDTKLHIFLSFNL